MSDMTNYYKSQIEDYKSRLAEEEEKEKFKSVAMHLHDIYAAYTDAGFSEEQAWYMTKEIFNQCLYAS